MVVQCGKRGVSYRTVITCQPLNGLVILDCDLFKYFPVAFFSVRRYRKAGGG